MVCSTRVKRRAAIEATRLLLGDEAEEQYDSDSSLEEIISEGDQSDHDDGNEHRWNESGDNDAPEIDNDLYIVNEEFLEVMDASDDSTEESDNSDELSSDCDVQLRAPSGKQWNILPEGSRPGRAPQRNLLSVRPGVKPGIHPDTPVSSFFLFMDEILEYAVRFTNLEARRVLAVFNRQNHKKLRWKSVCRDEMNAYIGLNILLGVYRSRQSDLESMWSDRDGLPVFRATMSCQRFKQIKRFFRLDDRSRRDENDPLHPVRDVWELFNKNLTAFYTPSPELTVDEQLLEYHGRIRFRVYIASKPGRYGIKIHWLNEASTGFALLGLPYIGEKTLKESERSSVSVPEAITLRLMAPFLNKGYNVTTWFTSCTLAESLLKQNTTLVGTIRSNRRDIPPKAKSIVGRERKSAEYFSSDDQVLLSYFDKRRKPVLLLSTMHRTAERIDSGLPEIIQFYNDTKGGTDSMDHMVRLYRSGKISRRWPLAFFFNMVDISLLNACIIYRAIQPSSSTQQPNRFRRQFLLDVGYQLLDSFLSQRTLNQTLTPRVKAALQLLGFSHANDPSTKPVSNERKKKKRCFLCPRGRDFKTTRQCGKCEQFVCQRHSEKVANIQCNVCK